MFNGDGKKKAFVKIVLAPADIDIEDLDDLPGDSQEIVDVPSVPPLTAEQFERYNRLWPVVFHQSNLQKQAEQDIKHCTDNFQVHRPLFDEFDCIITDVSGTLVGKATSHAPKTPLDHCVMRAIEDVSTKARASELDASQYLCTGYHVILKKEPCFMCAMALVHSRVASVTFVELDAQHGALSSATDCKWMQSCNHRYQVYRVEE